jgi:hypothetical protein
VWCRTDGAGSSEDNLLQYSENTMNGMKILALGLIVAGVLGLAYGSFTYTKETHSANVGPISLSVKDKETVNIPVWAGVAAILAGGGLLFMSGRKI